MRKRRRVKVVNREVSKDEMIARKAASQRRVLISSTFIPLLSLSFSVFTLSPAAPHHLHRTQPFSPDLLPANPSSQRLSVDLLGKMNGSICSGHRRKGTWRPHRSPASARVPTRQPLTGWIPLMTAAARRVEQNRYPRITIDTTSSPSTAYSLPGGFTAARINIASWLFLVVPCLESSSSSMGKSPTVLPTRPGADSHHCRCA